MLLGPNGRPISSSDYRKADPPKLGPAFGNWAGRDLMYSQLPGGGVLGFDLSKLTLSDYRAMREHYQINASLSVLSFMMHQLDWRIECKEKKIATFIEENIRKMWTRLIRAVSQSYWAGFSPTVLEFENDVVSEKIVLAKFKDLAPEECVVNWKEVKGYAPPGHVPPKFKIFDGIKQAGQPSPVPVLNSFWYPLLMENGNYYGRKLLQTAFVPWYFSNIVHLFANRYYERFGEPTPVGRAPFDADIEMTNGSTMSGRQAMDEILINLRNRSVVTLPSERDPITKEFDYTIEFLESQMRGADFEKYLGRLDEEMSLGIFTPVLLFRTADVGSYNLGVMHMQLFMWMLNALAGDMKEYIDRYVVGRLKDFNFGVNAPPATWEFRHMGKENVETVRAMLTELLRNNKAMPDLRQLGEIAGLDLTEVKQITQDTPTVDPNADPNAPVADTRTTRDRGTGSSGPRGVGQPRATAREISNRIASQVDKAWREKTFGPGFLPSFGFRRRFEESLKAEGSSDEVARELTGEFYDKVESWARDAIGIGMDSYAGPQDFMAMMNRVLDSQVECLVGR